MNQILLYFFAIFGALSFVVFAFMLFFLWRINCEMREDAEVADGIVRNEKRPFAG